MAVEQHISRLEYAGVNFQERVGANLRRAREAAGLSQEDLMQSSGVHRTQISKYERAISDPQLEAVAKLARALGVSAEEFLAGVDWQDDPARLVIRPLETDEQPGPSAAA